MSVTDRLAALSPKQRQALFEKLQEKGLKAARTHPTAPPILRVPRDRDLPLSFSQQRLWFIDQIEPGNPAYNIPQVLRLAGEIDPRLLQWIFSEIVRRHESLRTTFVSRDNGPVQVIASPEPVDLPLLDLSPLPEKERESQAQDLALAEVRRPFDLRRGPLLRLLLVRLAERNHLLLLTMHHIVSDGWSIGILVREITALYMAFVEGRPPSLPELPVQYADFAAWQVSWFQGEVLASEISFWKRQLAGLPPLLELPTDRPRPTVQTFRGATRPLHLGSDCSDAVRELCRRERVTPFMALLAAWALLLGRHAGQEDVVVGAPVAGRNRREVGGLIGFFVNTLVLRSDLSGNPSFNEFLHRVRQASLAAFAHQDLPFERIVEEVGVERNLAISPLFQVLFVLQNAPVGKLTVRGLALSPIQVDAGIAKFDLSLSLTDTEAGLSGALEFATDLFDPATVDRLRDHFRTLLASAMSDPQRRLAELPLLSSGELHQILWEWNDTAADYSEGDSEDRCLHELFSLQAWRTPGALALAAGEVGAERLTFAELDAAAERLAARLRTLGVGPEVVVALYLERAVVLGVAVLAVLKAGGAFLPIDLANPRERLAWVLEDARPLVVLTVSGLAPRLPDEAESAGGQGPLVICLDLPAEPEAGAPPMPPMPPMPQTTPDNLAYVIYTSGSTGRPKGTMIPHRGVVNYLSWAVGAYRVEEGCGAPVHTSLAFDLTLTSLLAPWLAGRCALLLPESEGAASLGLTLAGPPPSETGFSLVKLTPAHLQLLAEQPGAVAAGRTRALVVGGEALFGKSLEAWRSAAPATRVVNEYGPTETVVGCCVYEAPAGVLGDGPVPIGRPIANSRLYLVDDQWRPVPLGTPGELLIGGAGLARGYLRQPGLTAQRFLPDALGEVPGGRLYRTGDRVRQRPDGVLEYLGRFDDQVKIRGFRIELGEIEAALAQLPGVREAVVLVREDESEKRLVAYLASDRSDRSDGSVGLSDRSDDLRRWLAGRLPEPMIPSAFVVLPSLPLNANGKVDRRALAKIAPVAVRPVARFLTPQGPVQEVLAQIWTEVLGGKRRGLARIGAQDDFFTLGGHSLLATQVISRVRNAFGVELPLRALFEAPTVTALAARIDGERRGEHAQPSPILPLPRDRDLPLSFAQQRLWFIDQLEPGSPLYNVPVALQVEGPLDPRVLERSLSEIVGRHETLRTSFKALEGAPVQVIHPRSPFVLPVVDLSGLPESRRAALARRLAEEEAGRPFDLSRGPLLRALLLRLAEEDNVTALTMHHVASDGWSMGILVREVAALYAAFAAGRPSPLPELATQYADFAVWQHSWLRGELLESEIAYWRRQLAHLPPRLELPTDRPRPAVQSLRGAVRPVRLPAELTRQAQALSRHEGATLFMLLLAGFQALLARTSSQKDLAVGSPVAGRNRVEIEGLIGFFVNTLVLRGDLSGAPTFRELLGRARETALAAYLHQDVPFEKLVEELAPERSLAQTPLFQVMLVLQNAPMGSLEVQDLRLHPLPVAGTTSKFDLTVTLTEVDGGLNGTAEYATDLFDSTTIDRLTGHFERLLAAAVAAPERRIAELPLLSEAERGQIVIEWNDTGDTGDTVSFAAGAQELFAAQARRTPDAVAVVYGDDPQKAALTYAELAARAGRLASHLRRLGVGPDVLVGLFVERSLDMVVGILGILQAGGAYVPLDPGYPEQRLAFMLEDTRAPVVVTQEPLRGRVPAGNAEIVLLDSGEVAPHPRPLSHPLPPAGRGAPPPSQSLDSPLSRAVGGEWERGPGGEGLAYVIYTSGSTGRPKGVALSHGALRNLIDWHLATLLGGVRTLQIASVSFDASFHEMFACWGSGGTLVVVTEETRRDMQALADLLVEQSIEKAILPVVVLTQLAEIFAGRAELPPLREITTTGERLQTNRAMAALCERLPECAFHNHYGPSETHVATAFTLQPDPVDWQVYPSIGRPIRRSSAHVLEAGLMPAPVGVPGDLHLGGACVARGYLGRPGLTAERFVPDPFSAAPGGRLYRTGDTVRVGVNGELEYLGRFDDQIKIRGFRIELGEIEAALATHPAVREAIVVVRGEGAGRRLVACVIPAEGIQEPIQEPDAVLRAHLRDRLPDYMVPAAFVPVESFPLTPSGKVDRRALALSCPEPREAASAGVAAPLTPAEELLAGIWSEVLGVERVGIHQSFFALGGHSLLATQVMSRIRGVFGTDLPVRQLFESPTIAELARAVQQAGSTVQAPPIVRVPRNRDLPASFAQQRLWLIDQIEPGNPAYNIPLALRLSGEIEPGLLARIFSEIARRHEALRTTFASGDDGPVQVIAAPAPLELPLLDLSHLPAAEREAQARALALSEARRPFDLQRGPLLRLLLVRLAGTDWLLLLTLHHIVSDGWSLGVLVREVTALYEAFSQGLPSPLPELPVQYADFAAWQRSWLQGEALDAQLGYWRRRLAGAPAVLELPLDRPRPPVQSYRGATCPVVLSLPLSEAIGRLCRQQGVTPFMALLAGWAVLLGRHAGQDDVLVGTPIAGRNRREIENLIGFFVNTLVLRADLSGKPSGNPSLAELLGQVRRTALDAFAHQDLPFERLVEELAPERTLAHTPLFQVQLVLQNAPMGDLAVPGLAISTLGVDSGVAKFDLSLALSESPDGFAGVLAYAVDLFDRSTAERLAARFQTLLSGMAAADPNGPLHDLDVLSETERRQLLVDWSAAEERVSALSLHGLIERQAERTPDAVAVIFEEERWSYRDLVRRSREIAAALRGQGVGPGDRVAILDQRSAERVARVLGVLASGATYVAIDSGQPEAWRARILADLAPVRVLGPLPPVALEDHAPAAFEPSATGGDLPGYVVYTSGSTGRPKGIVAHHRGAATYLEWVIRNYGLTQSDVALQLAPLTFDASLRDTLAPLAAGGRIVIVPEGAVRDPVALLKRMEACGVTCLPSIVPSLLRLLVEEALASGRKVSSLRLILASGEKLHGADAAAVRRAFGDKVELINQYGPSEATMTSTWYPVTAADESLPALPVGRPAASARVFLLDRALRPVPPGAVGEICLGGPGLAFGYLGQPDRTAEVFIPDPFGVPGDRLYRTGDRGRYRPDGVLELLGRIDLQVKIRGQRVEPGEVEAVLRSHPAVREAVVAAFGEDEPRLAAWLVAERAGADDLRAFLAERLPASMIPADWAFLDALPLTPHGKVDRARLPEPGRERKAVQAPRDPTELRLVRLWEEILGSRSVGVSDNFFALGGHSLAAVRLMAGVRRLFGRQLPLSELFRRPTIEALAELLRHGAQDLPWSPLVELAPGSAEKAPLFCIHGAEGQALTFGDLARTLSAAGDDRPVFAFEARGLAAGQAPLRSIEEMAALYLAALREVRPRGPYRLLGYSMGSKIAFAMARELERDGETVEQLVLIDIPALPRTEPLLVPEIPEEVRALPDFDAELADRNIAVWMANQEASRRWSPAPYQGKVLLIVAEDGVCAGAADPSLDWGAVAEGGVEVVLSPGDHFTLFRPPYVETLAERIARG